MVNMLSKILFFTVALFEVARAIDIDDIDVPYPCRGVCIPVVRLTKSCDAQYDDNDTAELSCICEAADASTQIPLCEACVTHYDDDGADNDANELVRKCGFAYTTYNTASSSTAPSSTSAPSSPVLVQSSASLTSTTLSLLSFATATVSSSSIANSTSPKPTGTSYAAASKTGVSAAFSLSSAAAAGFNGTSSSTGTPGVPTPPSFSNPTQSSASQSSDNAAPAPTLGAVGVGLGVLGFALGML